MTVLYRAYRPQKFSDLVGQEAVALTILSQLESGKFSHAYLFYGPKGTGKTSTARILAKAVNCEGLGSSKLGSRRKILNAKPYTLNANFGEPCNKCAACLAIAKGSYLDVLEIDAASNRGIDEVRDLREKIKLSPINGRFKIYIIDEAHMLTTEAFNALLKTLEEPPAHVIFILCTTEVGKLPATIVSRLQKFHFVRAGKKDLVKVIEKIAKSENIKIEIDAAAAIAEFADGSYRDAISIFDQLSTQTMINTSDVFRVSRVGGWNQLSTFVEHLAKKDLKEAILTIEKISNDGLDISYFAKQIVLLVEKLLFIKIGILNNAFEDYSREQVQELQILSEKFNILSLQNLMKLFLIAESEVKLYPLPQIPLVLAVCKYIPPNEEDIAKVYNKKVHGQIENDMQGDAAASPNIEIGTDHKQKRQTNPKRSPIATSLKGGKKNLLSLKKIDSHGHSPRSSLSSPRQTWHDKSDLSLRGDKAKASPTARSHGPRLLEIEKNWEKFLGKVKSNNVHVVALLRSSRPIDFDGVNLTMEVFYRFHKEKLEEPKIIRMLDNVMQEIISKPVKFKFVLALRGKTPPQAVKASNVMDIDTQDMAKMAQEIFSK